MAVAHQPGTEPVAFPDVRRWVAFQAFGAQRILINTQSAMEDIEGAVAAGQYETAALVARNLVLHCLSIRSLAREGELDGAYTATFDPFAGLADSEIAEGMRLIQFNVVDPPEQELVTWVAGLAEFMRQTEALLGYDEPLPVLRTPEGTYAALRMARRWSDRISDLDLPALLPAEWIEPEQ